MKRILTVPTLGCLLSTSPVIAQINNLPNDVRARALLTEGLDSSDFAIRIQAITAISMVGTNEFLVTQLEELLKDKNVEVRLAAVHALADFKSPEVNDRLRTTLAEDSAPEVAFAAAKVLVGLGDPAVTMALMDVYDHKRKTQSSLLEQEKRSFFEEFHSPQSTLMFLLNKGIGHVPIPGAGDGFSAISELLTDPQLSARADVLFILTRTNDQESIELLRRALHDDDWSVRAAWNLLAGPLQDELYVNT